MPINSVEKLRAEESVSKMTLEEKAQLLSGNGWWYTHHIERLGIPAIRMADGPHGLRKIADNEADKILPATCFPTAPGIAATWNPALVQALGAALGREAQANEVQILLGPGVNMKRSPLGGRNFEYFSEDPLLTGVLAAAYINGVQGEGVGTSIKHFAVNNQEFERMATSSNLDERTLHEIYLPAFEMAVKEAQPWTIMSAYNLINGIHATEHPYLLTEILRDAWGFEGFVVSDWGAINDRVEGIRAGTNLEMPGSGTYNRDKIIAAVQQGLLEMEVVDRAVEQLLTVVFSADKLRNPDTTYDLEEHHAFARRVAGESIVLLKNSEAILPLNATNIAIIGSFAKYPRYQGAGSSQVNPTRISNAYDELSLLLDQNTTLSYADGYDLQGEATEQQIAEACQIAANAEVAVVFAGLPDSYESEGFDRNNLDLPEGHNRLIEAVSAVQPNLIVVLMNGSAVTMPWLDKAKGLVEGWLGGQAGGGALADVLTGKVNPSGKLPETFPTCLEQTPTYPNFPERHGHAAYGEGLFVGYRHYDKKRLTPLFPFGFGLSYTEFTYTKIQAASQEFDLQGEFIVEVGIKNTGKRAGQEVVQLYLHECDPAVVRPERELRAFTKVHLEAGEEKSVRLTLTKRAFAYYNPKTHAWEVKAGTFNLFAGGSSRDLPLKLSVEVKTTTRALIPIMRHSMIKDILEHPRGTPYYEQLLKGLGFGHILTAQEDFNTEGMSPAEIVEQQKAFEALLVFIHDLPLKKLPAISQGNFTDDDMQAILDALQATEA